MQSKTKSSARKATERKFEGSGVGITKESVAENTTEVIETTPETLQIVKEQLRKRVVEFYSEMLPKTEHWKALLKNSLGDTDAGFCEEQFDILQEIEADMQEVGEWINDLLGLSEEVQCQHRCFSGYYDEE